MKNLTNYSKEWAKTVVDGLQETYPRGCKIYAYSVQISKEELRDRLIKAVSTDQIAWRTKKECIKACDKIKKGTSVAYISQLINETVNRCVVDMEQERLTPELFTESSQ